MNEQVKLGISILFDNYWIERESEPEKYIFLRRHQKSIQKELKRLFGMNLLVRSEYIQLVKRPQELHSWMGIAQFKDVMDYALFCCCMAYVENLEADTPFMMDEIVNDIDFNAPEEMKLDWIVYSHRLSLIRVLQKMKDLKVIRIIQGETEEFAKSESNLEVLMITTPLARHYLYNRDDGYTAYDTFEKYWEEQGQHQNVEPQQLLYQKLMLEPLIQRTAENEELFSRLKRYYRSINENIEYNTPYKLELYRDYAAFTLDREIKGSKTFPSRKVIDDIIIQLATVIYNSNLIKNPYGIIELSNDEWGEIIEQLTNMFRIYWSNEYKNKSCELLSKEIIEQGQRWQLLNQTEDGVLIYPIMARTIGEMSEENE